MQVDIIDSVDAYVDLMKTIFDFDAIKEFFATNKGFTMLFDGMNGGKYIRKSNVARY